MLPINRRAILLFVNLFITSVGIAQEFGGNPPSIKWNQINNPIARIIFPQQLDSAAQRISNIFTFLNTTTQNSIGNKQRKINLVLQNQTTISNAYVGLGPYRSEFFLTPLQNSFELGSLPWTDQLAIHEYRHIQQYSNFNVGLATVFKFLFGDEGQALANNAAIPNWFYEGDAIYNETSVSQQGRGRLPFFFNDYRSLWQADKKYSWMKLRNGSSKDFVPNHYALGYLLVAYGREKYGDEFWKNVTQDAAAFKGLFYPFQKAIKKYSNKSYVEFRNDALNYFKSQPQDKQKINATHKEFINQEFPSSIDNNSFVYVRSGYKQIPSFYIHEGNTERKIRVKDVSIDNHFSYSNGKIIYAAYQPDIRWGYRDFSDIKLLDASTGNQQTITHHTKYFSPDINEEGNKIVAVDVAVNGKSTLHLLSIDGKLISALSNPDNLFYTYPKFYGNNKIITAVRNTKGEMSLAIINTTSGAAEYLTPYTYSTIGFPSVQNDTVYFAGAYKDEDKLFAVSLLNKKIYLLETDINKNGWGQYQPTVNGNKIIWTTFTANGYQLQQADKNNLKWTSINWDQFNDDFNYGITSINKKKTVLREQIPNKISGITKYNKATGLFNFHSIEPDINDPDYKITLVSENILNTFQSQLFFGYNRAEKFKKIGFSGVYGALFPYLSAGIDYFIDRQAIYRGKRIYFNALEPNIGINIPLNLSKGKSLTYFNIGTKYIYNKSTFQGIYKDTFTNRFYGYISNFLSLSNQIQKAKQHIYPRFAQTLTLNYKKAVTHYTGDQFVANSHLYLPGFFKTHNIILNGAFLKRDTATQLNFSSGFPFSRGYGFVNLHNMTKWGIDYHLPLIYPDAGFANIVYFLRVRSNLFYDDTRVKDFFRNGNPFNATFRSAGAELYFDTKWWNEAPVTFGIRYSYLLDKDLFGSSGKNRFEFILPLNILQK